MFDYLIFGNGFKAFYWALSLRKKFPEKKIGIRIYGPVGGVYSSIKKGKYNLDLGCHLWDYDQKFFDEFEINPKNLVPVQLAESSVNEIRKTDDFGIYDFRTCKSFHKTLKLNFLDKERKKVNESSLLDYYVNKHGPFVAQVMNNYCIKLTGKTLDMIDIRSRDIFSFERLLIEDHSKSVKLKKNGYDKIVAAKSQSFSNVRGVDKKHLYFTFQKGNAGFIEHINKLFKRKKIDLVFEDREAQNKLYTSFQNLNGIKELGVKIPMHLCYFLTKKFPYTYIHDYSFNPIFRASSPGHYSKQIFNKESYILLEIPDPNNLFDKKYIIELCKEYLKKYCSATFFNYIFFKHSFTSIFLKGGKYKSKNTLNPYLYGRINIMNEIDNFKYE